MKIFENKQIEEKYFFAKHPSGLKIYLYPKEDYNTAYAAFAVNFGSVKNKYISGSNVVTIPDGTAHYLEHKLFETEKGDAFVLFAGTGVSANACTTFEKTEYIFSCSTQNDLFKSEGRNVLNKSLKILLDFVQNPYFTEKGVEKERGIIAQEIKMYKDDPDYRAFFNCLGSLYHNHPIKTDIAGSEESIKNITPEILYQCHRRFYKLSNMCLCISGKFDAESVMETINDGLASAAARPEEEEKDSEDNLTPNEPEEIVNSFVSQKMEVINSIFNLGFKQKISKENADTKDIIVSELALSALILKSGKAYNRLLEKKLINTSNFVCEYSTGPFFAVSVFSGESKDPKSASEIICEEISSLISNGIEKDVFLRAKKIFYTEVISEFDGISAIANILIDFSFSKREIFDFLENISNLTLEEFNESVKNKFDVNKCALSVIEPFVKT
jgi:predicted Zn-dependent peptidase